MFVSELTETFQVKEGLSKKEKSMLKIGEKLASKKSSKKRLGTNQSTLCTKSAKRLLKRRKSDMLTVQ